MIAVTRGAVTPREVLLMRADVAVELCAAHARLARRAEAGGDDDGQTRVRGDGSMVTAIRSMEGLRGFLGSRGKP
jgi:hypothetical protein